MGVNCEALSRTRSNPSPALLTRDDVPTLPRNARPKLPPVTVLGQVIQSRCLLSYPLKPLQCQGSRDGYVGLWMRFFCYVFRVWALPPNLRSEVFGLRLSQQQLETISKIWDVLDGRREVERTTREDSSRSSSSQESGYRSEFSTSPLHRAALRKACQANSIPSS